MMIRSRLQVALPLVFAGALLAGCGSDATSSSSSSTTTSTSGSSTASPGSGATTALDCAKGDPAVQAALGSLPKSTQEGLLGVTSCEWDGVSGKAAVNTATKTVYGAALAAVEGGKTEPVAGLGDKAFIVKGFSASTGGGTSGRTLWVVKGDQVYSFALAPKSASPTNDQLVALAKPYVG